MIKMNFRHLPAPIKMWVLLQVISLSSYLFAFAFAANRPFQAPITLPLEKYTTVTSNANNQFCAIHRGNSRKRHLLGHQINRISRPFSSDPLLAFHQQREPENRFYNTNKYRRQKYYLKRESKDRSKMVLSATRRGGGTGSGRRRDGETLLPPSVRNSRSSKEVSRRGNIDSSTSSDSSPLAVIAKPISQTISTVSKPITTFAETIATSKKAQGRALLLLVSFLYGTLNVTLRAVYATDGAPVASVLSLVRQCLSVLTFVPILMSVQNQGADANEKDKEGKIERKVEVNEEEKIRPLWMAALELAFWNFGAQGLINAGLLFSPAARASFLTQTSVVMTPLISALAGERIKSSVWGGCAISLLGLGLISTAPSEMATGLGEGMDGMEGALSLNQGDFMILAGALSWSTYIFRTSQIAKSYSELDLQFTKTLLLAVLYGGWFFSTAASAITSAASAAALSVGSFITSGGLIDALTPLWSGWNSVPVWLLLAYSAIGPGAIADLLQQQGQKEVSASESNIILCMESIFAAVCAFILLGEVSSIREMVGGLLIVVAAILASK